MISDKPNHAAPPATGYRGDTVAAPRPRADRDSGDRFARSLQNEREKQDAGGNAKEGKKLAGDEDAMRKLRRNADDGGGGGAGYAGDQVGLRQADVVKATASAQTAGEALPAHLEKMAAAIQELAAKGIDAKFHLQLPLGPLTVDTATIGRDAFGNLAVRLQAAGVMSPALMSRLSADLAQRLRERKLSVTSVDFTQSQPQEPGLGTAPPTRA